MEKQIIIIILSVIIINTCWVTISYAGNSLQERIKAEEINSIEINIREGYVTVYKVNDGDSVEISGSKGNRCRAVDVETYGDNIRVSQKINWLIPITFRHSELFIGIPARLQNKVSVNQGSGKLTVKGIDVESIEINAIATQVKVDDVTFNNLNLTVRGGTATNTINLNRECGDINISTDVGRVNLNLKEIGGNLTFRGGNMSSIIMIPPNAPVKIVSSGRKPCKVEAELSVNPKYIFDIKAGLGNIKISDKI